ncbi:MAG: acyl-CoA dehydrogenase family protein [Pseudobdellovibrionaceae bacterium]
MSDFQSIDFFNLDQHLSTDEKSTRAKVRDFVTKEVMPIIADCFETQRFPKELIPGFAKLGVFGSTIQGYGCAGANATTYGLMMQEIERADSGLRSFVSVQGALCMYPISAYASEDLKKKYLPEMAQGKLIGCFGLTEPDFGSNPSGMTTHVRKEGSKYILNGHKRWLTNGPLADLAVVWAKNEEGKVCGFLVERNLPGIEVKTLERRLSLRASLSSEYIFKDVPVPATHKLEVEGLKGPFSCLNNARFGISWGVLGAAQDCYQRALEYTKGRSQFEKPLASHQLIQAKLVEMFTEITLGQMLAYHLGRLKDQNKATPEQISMAKMNNVSKALKIARMSRDLLGANGILGDYHVARHMMNLESVNTYEGTEDIHRLVLGQHITGIAAFR